MAHGVRRFMHGDGSMAGWFGDPGHYDRVAGRIEARLRSRIAADVADLGLRRTRWCSTSAPVPGRLPIEIARRNPGLRVAALDVSPAMVETARRLIPAGARITAEVGDVAALPYGDGTVTWSSPRSASTTGPTWPPRSGSWPGCRAPGGRIWIYDVRRALRSAQVAAAVAFPGRTSGSSRCAPGCSAGSWPAHGGAGAGAGVTAGRPAPGVPLRHEQPAGNGRLGPRRRPPRPG